MRKLLHFRKGNLVLTLDFTFNGPCLITLRQDGNFLPLSVVRAENHEELTLWVNVAISAHFKLTQEIAFDRSPLSEPALVEKIDSREFYGAMRDGLDMSSYTPNPNN